MKLWLTLLLIQLNLLLFGQASSDVCAQLDDLVNEVIPESFDGITFQSTTIDEVEDDEIYWKLEYPFLGKDYVYYTEAGDQNKRLLSYPLVNTDKDKALQFYIDLKQTFDGCDLVYTSFAGQPNPNIGLIATHTIGIDRRFYNSSMKLFQYVSDSISKYWIEYELTAPKLLD